MQIEITCLQTENMAAANRRLAIIKKNTLNRNFFRAFKI